jgi:sphingosine kinase
MDRNAPAGPAQPVRPQAPESGVEAAQGGADRVLVLSPGVTLTLGQDALLMSGMKSVTEMS